MNTKFNLKDLGDLITPENAAIIAQESGGDPNAVSEAGGKGLMQLMDATGKEWHEKLGLPGKYNPFDPKQNVIIGTAYYNWLKDQFNGDKELALTAYHTGIGNVTDALLKTGGTSLSDILDELGPVGKKYAASVMGRKTGEA